MSSENEEKTTLAAVMPIETYEVFRAVAKLYTIMLENGLTEWEGFDKCMEIFSENNKETMQ